MVEAAAATGLDHFTFFDNAHGENESNGADVEAKIAEVARPEPPIPSIHDVECGDGIMPNDGNVKTDVDGNDTHVDDARDE